MGAKAQKGRWKLISATRRRASTCCVHGGAEEHHPRLAFWCLNFRASRIRADEAFYFLGFPYTSSPQRHDMITIASTAILSMCFAHFVSSFAGTYRLWRLRRTFLGFLAALFVLQFSHSYVYARTLQNASDDPYTQASSEFCNGLRRTI